MPAVNPRPRRPAGPTPSRRERALATRRRIIEAALVRFREDGYASTTMDMIARDAGVAVQTVYFTFHTKAALLLAALTVSGGEPGAAEDPAQRAWYAQVLAAQTATRRLALMVELGNDIYVRISRLMPAVRAASSIDPAVDSAMEELVARRRDAMRRVIDLFVARRELRPGLDPTLALDLLIGIHRWETYHAFTVECGWSFVRYKAWQFATLAWALLPTGAAAAAIAPGEAEVADCSFADDLALFR